ncbi:hypothetical protein M885DRAFT_614886 [Pelagophyceae sp. CCMP2097]|nr:hypothetical protein M885DRAFT_614886 [Pelagophyceae sp. CCMP2097]
MDVLVARGWATVPLDAEARAATAELFGELKAFHNLPERRKALSHNQRGSNEEKHGGWYRRGEEPQYDANEAQSAVEDFCIDCHERSEEDQVWPNPECGGARLQAATDRYLNALKPLRRIVEATLSARLNDAVALAGAGPSILRLLRYPPAAVSLSAHTDFEIYTFVHQRVRGLQVQDGGDWIDASASPADDGVVVLIGDVFEFWTNGTTPAAKHRVRGQGEQRESIVCFHAAPPDAALTPQWEPFCEQFLAAKRNADAHDEETGELTQIRHLLTKVHASEANRERALEAARDSAKAGA